jgi:hypothetical protein
LSKQEELIQWIPVSEHLPAANVEVLICYRSKYEPKEKTTLATLEKNLDSDGVDWWVDGGCDDVGSVMYWADKPKGPKQ